MRLNSIFAAAALVLTLPASATPVQTATSTYSDQKFGYRVFYPAEWEIEQPTDSEPLFLTSQLENPTDTFRENVNLIVKDSGEQSASLRPFAPTLVAAYAKRFADFKQGEISYISWNGVEALQIDFYATVEVRGNSYKLHFLQQFAVVDGLIYVFTYTADQVSYDKFVSPARAILDTAKVK